MSFRDKLPPVSVSWNEGGYLDYWAFVHAFSGVFLGLVAHFAPLPFSQSFLLALALLILFEIWEVWMDIRESLENRVLDIILGAIGFVLAYRLAEKYLSELFLLILTLLLAALLVYLSTAGWQAYARRKERKRSLTKRAK